MNDLETSVQKLNVCDFLFPAFVLCSASLRRTLVRHIFIQQEKYRNQNSYANILYQMIENIFDHDIILQNERVLLRPLQLEDEKYFIPFVLNEPMNVLSMQ